MIQEAITSTNRNTHGARIMARTAAALTATALVAALAGCFPVPVPSDPATTEPAPVETEAGPESPTPDPVVEALEIPTCDTLLPIKTAKTAFSEFTAFLGENVPTDYYPWYQLPEMNTAIAGVTVARSCWWGIPQSDGSFSMLVAEIDPATRASVESALTTAGFSSVTMGTVTAREATRDGQIQIEAETHLFTGNVWILVDNGSLTATGIIAGSALDAMRTANPTLGL